MPKIYTLEEQLETLTPEQLEALKQELIKSRVEESGGTSVKGLLGRGAIRALSAFGEGAVLGLQGRPISEGSFMKEREPSLQEKLGILRQQKAIESIYTPKEWKPQTKEEALEFEKEKAEAKSNKYTPDEITSIVKQLGDMGGNIPPGTTVKLGDFTIPLNPKLTQEQAQSVAAATEVQDDVDNLKLLLDEVKGTPGIIVKTKLPYWMIGGKTEEIKRLRDQLAARIPFAKGGKQLTPFEAKTLFILLPQPGQEYDTIIKNLNKFTREFNRLSEIATKGTAGTIKTEQNLSGITSSGIKFTIE